MLTTIYYSRESQLERTVSICGKMVKRMPLPVRRICWGRRRRKMQFKLMIKPLLLYKRSDEHILTISRPNTETWTVVAFHTGKADHQPACRVSNTAAFLRCLCDDWLLLHVLASSFQATRWPCYPVALPEQRNCTFAGVIKQRKGCCMNFPKMRKTLRIAREDI